MSNRRRSALVTGSGRNIGRATAVQLAKDGFNIVINGSHNLVDCEGTKTLVDAEGVSSYIAMGDIGIRERCNDIANEAITNFGGIDVLVNNAAIRPSSPFLEMDELEWERVLAIGMHAAFWLAREILPGMIERGWGRIINFAGMNAIHGYNGRAHVSVAKHGAWGLTKALALEFGPEGITSNIISPGPIAGVRDTPEEDAHIQHTAERVPVGRVGSPEEVAAVISMLAGDSGAYVNGQILQINGGAET